VDGVEEEGLMPAPQVKSLAKKSGKSVVVVERLWKKAKKQAAKQGRAGDYKYIVGIVKNMLGLKEVKMQEQKPKLTKAELVAMLDAKIRERARWRVRDMLDDAEPGSLVDGTGQFNDEKITQLAVRMHDDIVADFSYNETLVLATRALKPKVFTAAYVRGVIKRAIRAGQIKVEHAALADTLREAVKGIKVRKKV